MQLSVSNDTLRKVNSLPEKKRTKVINIVRRHLKACEKNGCPLENLDRVYLEAMEVAEMELKFPETEKVKSFSWEPARHYDQYISPKAA